MRKDLSYQSYKIAGTTVWVQETATPNNKWARKPEGTSPRRAKRRVLTLKCYWHFWCVSCRYSVWWFFWYQLEIIILLGRQIEALWLMSSEFTLPYEILKTRCSSWSEGYPAKRPGPGPPGPSPVWRPRRHTVALQRAELWRGCWAGSLSRDGEERCHCAL